MQLTKTIIVSKKMLLVCLSLLYSYPIVAQNKQNQSNASTQTMQNLQAMRERKEQLKIQKSLSIKELFLLQSYNIGKVEEYLTGHGWQFNGTNAGTDSTLSSVDFIFNEYNYRETWYQLNYRYSKFNKNMVEYIHKSDKLQRILQDQLPNYGYNVDVSGVDYNGIYRVYINNVSKKVILSLTRNQGTPKETDIIYTMLFLDKDWYEEVVKPTLGKNKLKID